MILSIMKIRNIITAAKEATGISYEPKTEIEKRITKIVTECSLHPDAKIIFSATSDCYISLPEKHYEIVIATNVVAIVNTVTTSVETFGLNFTNSLRKILYARTTADVKLIQKSIENKKLNMLDSILTSIKS